MVDMFYAMDMNRTNYLKQNQKTIRVARVRDDIAMVTWLGNEPILFNSLLTKKLARPPIGITPVEIAECFRYPDPDNPNAKQIPFHSIVMPLNIHTNKHQPEALI